MSYVWLFKKFLRQKSPYPMARALNVSEKTIYSWATEEDSPFHRPSPFDKAIIIMDVLNRHSKELLYELLFDIATRYGYSISPSEGNFKKPSELMKELNDAVSVHVRAMEDGQYTKGELEALIQEGQEALLTLQELLMWAKKELERKRKGEKPLRVRKL